MASSKRVVVIASLLDLTAFSLALMAEFTRSTAIAVVDESSAYNYCVYSSKIATLYGICALLCLMASQFMKCFINYTKGLNPGCLVVSYIISWVSFVQAVVFLVIGSVINAKRTKFPYVITDDPLSPFCETLRKGVFMASAAFIFVAVFTFDIYYICHFRAMANSQLEVNDTSDHVDDDLKKNFVSKS